MGRLLTGPGVPFDPSGYGPNPHLRETYPPGVLPKDLDKPQGNGEMGTSKDPGNPPEGPSDVPEELAREHNRAQRQIRRELSLAHPDWPTCSFCGKPVDPSLAARRYGRTYHRSCHDYVYQDPGNPPSKDERLSSAWIARVLRVCRHVLSTKGCSHCGRPFTKYEVWYGDYHVVNGLLYCDDCVPL